eukprot:gene50975-69351_t
MALESCIAMLDYLGQKHWWCPDRIEQLARDVAPSLRAMRGKLAAPIREAAAEIRKFLEGLLGEHAAAAGAGSARPRRAGLLAPGLFGHGLGLNGLAGASGKIDPAVLAESLAAPDVSHRQSPAALSLTNATEYGTVYSHDELQALIQPVKSAGYG